MPYLNKSNVQFWNNHFLKVFLNYNKTAVIASTGMDPCNQHTMPLQLTPTASVPSKNPISVPVRRPISDLLLMPELIVTICLLQDVDPRLFCLNDLLPRPVDCNRCNCYENSCRDCYQVLIVVLNTKKLSATPNFYKLKTKNAYLI